MIKIEFDISQTVYDIANKHFEDIGNKAVKDIANIIQKDIEVNIAFGLSINGGTVKPNKRGTRVLFKSGALFRSVINEPYNAGKGRIIYIGGDRTRIGGWLHYGTKRMVARPFFGYSKKTDNKINSYLKNGR